MTRVSKNIIISFALVLAVGLISNQSVMNTFAISYGGNQYISTQYKTNPTATTANVNNNQPKSTLKSESQSATVDTSSTVIKKG